MKIYGSQSERGKQYRPGRIAEILNQRWEGDSITLVADLADADGEPQQKRILAIREFLDTLRGLVDQWIDSGKNRANTSSEEPWERDISRRLAEYPESPQKTMIGYWERNPPRVAIGNDGRSDISIARSFRAHTDALFRARERAIYEFVMLLDSPTRERLSRCDDCKTYFVRARAPKKKPIYHGTYCPNSSCKIEAGVKRMTATRENRTKWMVELAAQSWPKWKPTRQHGKQSEWIAKEMNKTLRRKRDTEITGKWVTQHREEIEAELERRNYAKS